MKQEKNSKLRFYFLYFLGVIPFCILFIYGLYLLKVFHRFGFLTSDQVITSKNFSAILLVSFLVLFSIIHLFYLSLNKVNFYFRKDGIVLILVVSVLLPFIWRGPFFQPPSDPIFHAQVMWDFIGANHFDHENRSVIGKSIFAALHLLYQPETWGEKLNILWTFHLITSILLILSAYFSGRLFGLNAKWAGFSTLFFAISFGTSYFSYLNYYSLAPTSINLSFYWLLSGLLFRTILIDKKNNKLFFFETLYYFGLIIFIAPILFYNHKQEVGFLFFILELGAMVFLVRLPNRNFFNLKNKFILISLFLFFPFTWISNFIPQLGIVNSKQLGIFQNHITSYSTIWYFGRINGPRVFETLAVYGYIPVLFLFTYLVYIFFLAKKKFHLNSFFVLALIPGLIPFWIILMPTNLLIWLKGIDQSTDVFWRFCYTGQYWITISFILHQLEHPITKKIKARLIR